MTRRRNNRASLRAALFARPAVWVLGACLLACISMTRAQDAAPEPLSAFPQSLLSIRTAGGKVINFKVWTADTPQREQQGLMFIRQMDLHAGMLFLFPQHEPVSMWMKNTFIPLDMLFISARGKIDGIEHAVPQSLDIIRSPKPEYAVLELNGGACEQLGIRVGDQVLHATFKRKP